MRSIEHCLRRNQLELSHRLSGDIDPRIVRIVWVNIASANVAIVGVIIATAHTAKHHISQYQIELQQHKLEPIRLVESVVQLHFKQGQVSRTLLGYTASKEFVKMCCCRILLPHQIRDSLKSQDYSQWVHDSMDSK